MIEEELRKYVGGKYSSRELKIAINFYRRGLTDKKPTVDEMLRALRTEYEKGRADAFAEMQKEWSEEDKDFMYDTLSNLTELKDRYGEGYGNVGKCIDWLKSLKQRYTWKPSDEQMRALHDLNLTGNISYAGQGKTLIELYNNLKKLTE